MKAIILGALLILTYCQYTTYSANEGPFAHLSNEEFAKIYLNKEVNELGEAYVPYTDGSWAWSSLTKFDWRDQKVGDKVCVHDVLNQGSCGSCWAFGTSEFASDRLCIASNGAVDVVLSPQFLVDCDNDVYPESGETGGCAGAMTQVVVDWISNNYLVPDSCYPYFSGTTKE
jgi:cathepsin B